MHKYQKKIVTQIEKTQRLIQTHLSLLALIGIILSIYLVPFLFMDRDPRIIATGVMIIVMFNYNLFFQFLRKKPVIQEGHKYLRTLRKHSVQAENHEFIFDISQYLNKLYNILFFNWKKNLIPSAFLESYEEEQYTAISNQMMISLRNDMVLNSFIGALEIFAACLSLVFMPDRVHVPFHAILLALLVVVYVISTTKSIKLKYTMKSWMEGFNDLQSWAHEIESMSFHTPSPQSQHRIETVEQDYDPSQQRIFCHSCGEPGQQIDKYCQNCGKLNSSQIGEA